MRDSLQAGIILEHRFTLPDSKMVPALYPEAPEFQQMPAVFATGFLVGLLEWACLKAVLPHLDSPHEQTVGTHIDINHTAATPAGLTVVVQAKLVAVAGRRLHFEVVAHDDVEQISYGMHDRFVIDRARFDASMQRKRQR